MGDKKQSSADHVPASGTVEPQAHADPSWKQQALEYWAQGRAAVERIANSLNESVDGAVKYMTTGNDIMSTRARQNLAEADGSAEKARAARAAAAEAAAAEEAKRVLPNGMAGAPGKPISYAEFKSNAKNQRNARFLVEHGEAATVEVAFTVLWARHPINEKLP